MNPVISVCIVTRGRTELLAACLDSLAAQISPPTFELLVCSDGDSSAADVVVERFAEATVGEVTRAFPGVARNLLVERARGDLLLFLDDDVVVQPGMLRRLGELAERHPDIAVFGGPNLTPPRSSEFQLLQGEVLGCALTTGPVRRRYGAHPAVRADERDFILCNLAIRRAAMHPFASDLHAGEESALLAEMTRRGIAMRYDPELVVYHERRPTYGGFARQILKYGHGRGLVLIRKPRAFRCVYLLPLALIAYLLALPLLAWRSWLWTVPAAAYALSVVLGAVHVARTRRRWRNIAAAAAMIVTTHVLYGVGLVQGLVRRRRAAPEGQPRWRQAEPIGIGSPAPRRP